MDDYCQLKPFGNAMGITLKSFMPDNKWTKFYTFEDT